MVEEVIDLTQENVLSPTGIQGNNVILNLGHSRMRAVYWRQIGNGDWVQTRPLPADPLSISYYFSKGFRARPITRTAEVKTSENLKCPTCGFKAASPWGLQVHQRKHK